MRRQIDAKSNTGNHFPVWRVDALQLTDKCSIQSLVKIDIVQLWARANLFYVDTELPNTCVILRNTWTWCPILQCSKNPTNLKRCQIFKTYNIFKKIVFLYFLKNFVSNWHWKPNDFTCERISISQTTLIKNALWQHARISSSSSSLLLPCLLFLRLLLSSSGTACLFLLLRLLRLLLRLTVQSYSLLGRSSASSSCCILFLNLLLRLLILLLLLLLRLLFILLLLLLLLLRLLPLLTNQCKKNRFDFKGWDNGCAVSELLQKRFSNKLC